MGKIYQLPPAVRIMRRNLVGALFAILGLMDLRLWAGAVAAPMLVGTVVAVSGSCTAGGHELKRGDAVQVGDALDVPTTKGKLIQKYVRF